MRTPSRRPRAGHHLPSKLQHVELGGQALTMFQGNAKLNSESEMLNNFHNKKYHPLWQAHTTLIPLRHRFSPLIKSRDVNYYNRYRMQMFYVCFNYELKVNVICTHGMDISCARDQWNLQMYLCSQIAVFPLYHDYERKNYHTENCNGFNMLFTTRGLFENTNLQINLIMYTMYLKSFQTVLILLIIMLLSIQGISINSQ